MANGPHLLLRVGSRAAREYITISGIPSRLNYYVIFTVHQQFKNVAAGRITQPGGTYAARRLRVEDSCSNIN